MIGEEVSGVVKRKKSGKEADFVSLDDHDFMNALDGDKQGMFIGDWGRCVGRDIVE